MDSILDSLLPLTGFGITTVVSVLVLFGVHRLLRGRWGEALQFRTHMIMLGLTLVALVAVVISLPIEDSTRSEVLRLLGLLLSAAIALSSTTFLSNAMGGLMLRSLRNFKIGDFIRVDDHFGRVTERGLFHTEIQTEDRDLITLPNLMLVTSAVRHLRRSGTIVSTTVSLGYDTPRGRIETCLVEAAAAAGLEEPYVQVLELGDFSVSYRIAGLLVEVKQVLSVRSDLAKQVMDALHGAGIEIVSPTVMTTRALDPRARILPTPSEAAAEPAPGQPESVAFDKADEAEQLERRRQRGTELAAEIAWLETDRNAASPGPERDRLAARIDRLSELKQTLEHEVEAREDLLRRLDEE